MTKLAAFACLAPLLLLPFASPSQAQAQTQGQAPETALQPLQDFAQPTPGLGLHQRAATGQPFTVAGPRGVLLGQQEGTFEAWILPVKLLSHFALRVEVDGYSVPIELNPDAAQIDVFPDHTTITYAHIALTVRQTMFTPENSPDGTGAVVLFSIDSIRPVNLTFSFTPEMRPMWPARGEGTPSAEWVPGSSAYILHTDFPDFSGAIALPTAQPGTLAPYQEKPQTHPLEFKLRYDPAKDRGKTFPLLMAVGQTAATAAVPALLKQLGQLNDAVPTLYRDNVTRFARMQQTLTSIHTPDAAFNDAFHWAEVSIEQLRARSVPGGETGLVAGYYSSGDSARPGFGWYFGRDTLYTLYAIQGMGDFALSREALEFLLRHQREDGKMMHEYSQTAASVDWKAFPYLYAAADSTPLFLTALADYVNASGDVHFLEQHRDAFNKAWQFEITHDSDNDGIYDNVQGTGWVESWPGGQPHQEIYLALLDQQASAAMAGLAAKLGDQATSKQAAARAATITQTIEREYFQPATGDYAFSRNADGSLDKTATLYPILAWWSGGPGLQHPANSLRRWDSHDFSTDWGTRDVAESDSVFDPISYHQGSVWPLFTGWAALADYRSGNSLSGYSHLMQNAGQTTTQDLGAVTELLSGAFFQPFGRSTSHQLWSSAMVITPALRGLFGLTLDAAAHTVHLQPHLPASWPAAELRNLHVGDSTCTLTFTRAESRLNVRVETTAGQPISLQADLPGSRASASALSLPLPAVEVELPHDLPAPGARTAQVKVLSETPAPHSLALDLEGQAGTDVELGLRVNSAKTQVHATGASLGAPRGDGLRSAIVHFGPGTGYVTTHVVLSW